LGAISSFLFVKLFGIYAGILILGAILIASLIVLFDEKPNLLSFWKKIVGFFKQDLRIPKIAIGSKEKDFEPEEEVEEIPETTKEEKDEQMEYNESEVKEEEEKFPVKKKFHTAYTPPPLTLLEKDQEIEVIATARLGKGSDHEKYTPGLCYYRHLYEVSSKNSHVEKLVSQSRGLVKPEKGKDGIVCDLNESIVEEITQLDAQALKQSKEILFIVESFGQLPAKEIVLRALRVLGDNVEAFEKAFK
jgi:hypothetical protein